MDENVTVASDQVIITHQTQEVHTVVYTADQIDSELSDIAAAIADIDNCKARRLQNLTDRQTYLQGLKAMLSSDGS